MRGIVLAAFLCSLQDPAKDAEKAIQSLRIQKSYRTKFRATIEAPGSDPLKIEGESVWVQPGLLYIQYTDSGKDQKCIVRAGDQVFVYHEFYEDWVTSQEMGNPGAGRGVQNPDEVLAVLQKHANQAKVAGSGYTLEFTGADIEAVMKEQASQGGFDWKGSKATASLSLKDGLLHRFGSKAELVSLDDKLNGKTMNYSAEVEIVTINQEASLTFKIGATEVPLSDKVREEIEKFLTRKP